MFATPFICRFAEPIPDLPLHFLRYDVERQVAQAFVDGEWFDTPDAPGAPGVSTRFTKVVNETNDDE